VSDLNAEYLLRQAAWGRTITDAEIDELGLPEHVENVLVRFINSTTAVLAAGGLDSRRVAQEIAEEGAEVIAGHVQAETRVQQPSPVNVAEDHAKERAMADALYRRVRGW
jgi:heptaprenylglyceryl phosphate synthase